MTASTTGFLCGAGLILSAGIGDRPSQAPHVSAPPPRVTSAPAGERVVVQKSCPHRCRKCRKVEADIEKLRATNPPCTPDLCVAYEVEIEDACPGQCFDLVLQVRHRKNLLLEATIPLDQPTEVDDDERKFRGAFVDCLSLIVLEDRKHLRIEAKVVERGSGRTLDRESERVRDSDDDKEGCIMVEERVVIEEWPSR